MDNKLLHKAYFIGGSPCSGKSTVAARLSDKYNLDYFKIDDYEREHLQRSDPQKQPVMYSWTERSWEEIWMRPVPEQVEEEFEFYRERWEMIKEDLDNFDRESTLIMEGAALLPELIKQLQIDRKRVIYMIPSLKFQIRHYSQREFIKDILSKCDNPQQAFTNWMERDHIFGQKIKKQAENLGFKVIKIDGTNTINENVKLVSEFFELE